MKKIFWRLSRIKWNNKFKETYWRLVYNGLVVAERITDGKPCAVCTAQRPGRLHHFWECPAATALVTSLSTEIGAAQITRQQLWLLDAPDGINKHVWEVVCLAAITALNAARKLAYKQVYTSRSNQSLELTATIQSWVVPYFWELIADFSAVCPTQPWLDKLNNTHPFLMKSEEGKLEVNHPQSIVTPQNS
jgi:hypothetical protein